jgi:hypothetical protein
MARLILAVVLVLALAPAADAATVSISAERFPALGGDSVLVHTLVVDAAPGEANLMTVTREAGAVVTGDAGVAPVAGKGCATAAAGTVRCATPGRADVVRVDATIRLGDRDDRLTVTGDVVATVEAGEGADAVTSPGITEGGPGDDTLTGTEGDDGLGGGPGDDVLFGLGGDDDLVGDTEPQDGTTGAPFGDDVLDGGAGADSIVYIARQEPVAIDLGAGEAGQPGERDVLTAIEDAIGGQAADRIVGTEGPNRLDGVAGADVIRALGGDDDVAGGRDVDAGPGDDRLVVPRGRFSCGPGADRVAAPPRRPLPRGCERVELDVVLTAGARPRVGRAGVLVDLRSTCRCRLDATLALRRRGVVLARGAVRVGRRARVTAVLPLTAAGRRALRRPVTATITLRTRAFRAQPFSARIPRAPGAGGSGGP